MADPSFSFYETDSTPLGAGTVINDLNPIDFGSAIKGSVNYADKTSIHLWNDKGGSAGSDTATNIRLSVVCSGDAGSIFDGTDGNDDAPCIEARSRGAYGVAADSQEDWTPIGPSNFLELGDMPSNSMRVIELRLSLPYDAETMAVQIPFELRVNYD